MKMGSRRRVSVDFYTGQAVSSMQQTVEILHQLWDDVSMEDHQRMDRVDGFYKILKELMGDVIASEKKMVESVHASIDQWLTDVRDMRNELGMPAIDLSAFQRGSVALFKALDKERRRLSSLKEGRLNGQVHIINELVTVAARIGEDITELSERDKTELWDNEKMDFWQHRLENFCRTLNERLDQARQWKADFRRWVGQSEREPTSEMESAFYEVNLEDPGRIFDKTFVDEFREAHQMAKDGYIEWIEQADFDYTEAVVKLAELWELCHVPEGDRRFAPKFNPNVHTAGDVRNVKSEVAKLTRFHEERAAVYNKLKEWKELWAEKLSFENHANDKSYYQNRGGQLQALLQRQKHIENCLPAILRELKKENDLYKNEHPDAPIVLDGLEPPEYVEWVIREYKEQKEIERSRKKKGIASQTPDSRMTPKKRAATPAFQTPGTSTKVPRTQSHVNIKTPLKKSSLYAGFLNAQLAQELKKYILNAMSPGIARTSPQAFSQFMGTPGVGNRDISIYGSTTSLQSVIAPVREPMFGPKTSSPIEGSEKYADTEQFRARKCPVGSRKGQTMKNITNDPGKRP